MLDHPSDDSGQEPSGDDEPIRAEIVIGDETRSWPDVADQLPANMIAQLERAEELKAAGVAPLGATNQADSAALSLLFKITFDIEAHQADVRFAQVAMPDHVARAGQWMNMGDEGEPDWVRTLEGARFEVGERLGHVVVEGFQKAADGSIEWGLRVVGDGEGAMEASAARKLARALLDASDVLEGTVIRAVSTHHAAERDASA